MTSIPIVTIHKYNAKPQKTDYAVEVVKQSCFLKNKTYSITDYPVNCKDELFYNVNIEDLGTTEFHKFNDCYEHMSTNLFEFEKVSFNRFFLIKRFMEKYEYSSVFHIDSDVLLYTSVEDCKDFYSSYDFTLTNSACISNSYLSYEMVKDFCEKILKVYELKEKYFWYNDVKHIYTKMQNLKLNGGICDMTFLKHYTTRRECNSTFISGEMTSIITGQTFDHHIKYNNNEYEFENDHKKIKFISGLPYCFNKSLEKNIQFLSLHFQGDAKRYLHKYTTYNV